jgi:hypothetical protein
MSSKNTLSRREFFKLTALTLGGFAMSRGSNWPTSLKKVFLQQDEPTTPDFPENVPLGRICAGYPGTRFDIKSEPYWDAPSVGTAWYDDVFEWKQEVIAKQLDPIRINQRWVETPLGYIYAEYVQKTKYLPQKPVEALPETSTGDKGMWVEIVKPYTGMSFVNPPAQYWIREAVRPRLYYSQVFWAFNIRQEPSTGQTQYCLKQLYGALPDAYWVDAKACRLIRPEEVEPIHVGAERKKVIVDLQYQTLACFEGEEEVFFTHVTTGGYNYNEEKWLTPIGKHTIWRKMISTHMSSGPAVGNFDISGVAWTTLFDNNGAAVHSTYWHNYYGTPRSHGCVNARPEDAKWIWRWTEPSVSYYPGEKTVQGLNQSTIVEVVNA